MLSAEEIRKKMRISHTHMDADIGSNMEAARLDMSRASVRRKRMPSRTRQWSCTARHSLTIWGRGSSSGRIMKVCGMP